MRVEVEVRTRFDGRWAGGFELIEIVRTPGGVRYRVRASAGRVLPTLFTPGEVRASNLASAVAVALVPVAFED